MLTNPVHADCIPADLLEMSDALAQIRRDIHAHPSLRFATDETLARIKTALDSWGIRYDEECVPHGLIAIVEGKKPGRTIGLRADIDALPMPDLSENAWRSTHEGIAHACGHDGHQTWLMGALWYLSRHNEFAGRVIGVFQPAEEISAGANHVIKCGALKKYGIEEIYGAHSEPFLDKGVIGTCVGPLQAAADGFFIRINGKGTHGGRPHMGVDPIPVASQIVLALQTLVSRKMNPIECGVLSVCSVVAGSNEAFNVVPGLVTMSGTVRTYLPEVRDAMENGIKQMTQGIAEANGCTAEVEYQRYCAAVNNPELQTTIALDLAEKIYGKDSVVRNIAPMMSSEDFSAYQQEIPGVMLRIGVRDENHKLSVHNPGFDFNDDVLCEAAYLLSRTVLARLEV